MLAPVKKVLSELLASKGEPVTFMKDNKVCLGWVGDRVREGQFMVQSRNLVTVGEGAVGLAGCTYIVKETNQPVLQQEDKISFPFVLQSF